MRAWALLWLATVSPLMAEDRAVVAADLDTREVQLENLYADYWRTEFRIAMGDQNLSSRPIQEKIRGVVADESFLRELDRTRFSTRQLKTRRKLFLNEAVYTKSPMIPR